MPKSEPVDDWWVNRADEAIAEVAEDGLGLELPPLDGEGFLDLGFSAIEVILADIFSRIYHTPYHHFENKH